MEDGVVTESLSWEVMRLVPVCCTRITTIFKHDRYSYRSNAFIQHGSFTWYWRIRGND